MFGESTVKAATATHQAIIATVLQINFKNNNKLDQTNNRWGQKSPLATRWKVNDFNCAVRHNLGDLINFWLSEEASSRKRL